MIITIDFGGTNIKIGLVDQGKIVGRSNLPSYSDKGMIVRLSDVEQEIKVLLKRQGSSISDCSGLGIATPGLVDVENCVILSINEKYSDAVGFNFQDWAREAFSLPMVLENDARAALLGEIAYGVAEGEKDAVLLTFGTGIGTAVIMNGQVVRGKHSQAGILGGHFTTDVYGNECNCGNLGCLEAQAGHWALSYSVKQHPTYFNSVLSKCSSLGYSDIIEAAQQGDQVGVDVLEGLLNHWSAGIVNMIHAYDPETVILSGGLMKASDFIVPILRERVRQRSWTPWGDVKMVVANDPDVSVLLGLASLVCEE
ncbi:ROK family protein [Cohnella abietis]|uniref:Glucokinase n=1 Tax=Cohnella abietis TaxID=2507935 RepID=A0A3T1CZM6_9BACL|nr:ROK family protein [Cohnella abietis]BBI31278.1 glucokinase [Cohnella abietis]